MAPIRKHFRVQILSGPNFFFRKHSWSLKTHFNGKMSEIRQKKVLVFFFVRPQPHLDPKMEHFERIYRHTATVIGIMGNLNAQLEKKLLTVFEKNTVLCEKWLFLPFEPPKVPV